MLGGHQTLNTRDFSNLSFNQRILAAELERRGVDVRVLHPGRGLCEAEYDGVVQILTDIGGLDTPKSSVVLADDKWLAGERMQAAGLSVPQTCIVTYDDLFGPDDACGITTQITRLTPPWVAKPVDGIGGEGVRANLLTFSELRAAAEQIFASQLNKIILVQEQFNARHCRLFITRDGYYCASELEPPSVVGNGHASIEFLAFQISYKRMHPRRTCEGAIVRDAESESHLAKQGLSWDSILAPEQHVFLRTNTNLLMGGSCRDMTEVVHSCVVQIAHKALCCIPGLPLAGVDILCRNPTELQTPESYRILEVNALPGIGMHLSPGYGVARDVVAVVADGLFPATQKYATPSSGKFWAVPTCNTSDSFDNDP